jgi:hypothetical protein
MVTVVLPMVPDTDAATALMVVVPVTLSGPSVPLENPQRPPTQGSPAAQARPQAPQLFASVLVFTSQPSPAVRLQSTKPALHTNAQVPATQTRVALARVAHEVLHPPQKFGSLLVFTHAPEHAVSPAPQEAVQLPPEHTCPAPQAAPAEVPVHAPLAPQLRGSLDGSTQRPAQFTCPVGQDTTHAPPLHTWPVLQVAPAEAPVHAPLAPQKLRSVAGSTQRPAQFTWVPGQDTWQLPEVHTCPAAQMVPALVSVHAPLAPQKARSVLGSTQRPMQFTCPAGQDTVQRPPEHTCPASHAVPALVPAHAPLAPQKRGSVAGSTQRPPQTTCPAGHVVAQRPPAHNCPEAQGIPAPAPVQSPLAPQKPRSVLGSMHTPPQLTCPATQDT